MKQNYDKHIIEGLFHQYFPEKEIHTYELCEGGVENSNFLVQTVGAKYILKIFENSKNETEIVRSEAKIMDGARAKGIHIPEIFGAKNTGDKIVLGGEGKPVMLMEFIEGKQFRHGIPENICLYNLGKETACLHAFLKEITGIYPVPHTHKFDFKYIIKNRELRNLESPYLDYSLLEKTWQEIDDILDSFLELEQQIIHNDLNNGNVVFTEDMTPYLIDFSDVVVSSRIQDVAISLTQWCFSRNWYPEGVEYYLEGYESVAPLSMQEKNCLFACIQMRMMNLILIPFLDTGLASSDELFLITERSLEYLKKFHEFGKDNFIKYI